MRLRCGTGILIEIILYRIIISLVVSGFGLLLLVLKFLESLWLLVSWFQRGRRICIGYIIYLVFKQVGQKTFLQNSIEKQKFILKLIIVINITLLVFMNYENRIWRNYYNDLTGRNCLSKQFTQSHFRYRRIRWICSSWWRLTILMKIILNKYRGTSLGVPFCVK